MKEIIQILYDKHKVESKSYAKELAMSECFKRGAEYGRSETLRKLLEYLNKNNEKGNR